MSSIGAVAAVSMDCGALDPYDGLCLMSGPVVRTIVDWDSAE